jgi:superfamily I DNA and RNA helicase
MGIQWKQDIIAAVRRAKIEIIGQDDIKNEAQARVAIAIIQAYGNSSAGFIYFEPCTAKSTIKPPDVLLCHPDVGLLIIEVKGHSLDGIQGVQAGNLLMKRDGYVKPENPFRQAESVLFDNIEPEVKKRLGRHNEPLYNIMVAFPNITEAAWISAGYDQAIPGDKMLFQDTLRNTQKLRGHIDGLVLETLEQSKKDLALTKQQADALKEVFGDSAVINERRPVRIGLDEQKLGADIDELVSLEKYLSAEQQTLSRLYIDGFPRLIRGVAGSGKSVVLANLVARYIDRKLSQPQLDARKPTVNVAVLCFNRALVHFLQRKIRHAYKQFTLRDLPSDTLTVTHYNGLLWDWSEQGILHYIPIKNGAEHQLERAIDYRKQILSFADQNPEWFTSMQYDAIFIDEGQDLIPEEYQVLLELIRTDPDTGEKAFVIFYDDAQNLYARSRPNWKQIGIDVARGDRAKVMKECFRNPHEVIELAFNVLLGSKADAAVRVKTRTFADVSYLRQAGLVEELNDYFRVKFAERKSLKKPEIKRFPSRDSEKHWIAHEISRLIRDELVRPEDIVIIFHRHSDFSDLAALIRTQVSSDFLQGFIEVYGQNNENKDSYIFREGHLTITTTYSVKGYDAPIVFVVGVDLFETNESGRASFYVGATRSKMILYITGKDSVGTLLDEVEAVSVLC